MKKSKVILALVCAVLLVCASVLGTLAYLTDSDTVTNTFTVGNVQITLDEAKVNGNGEPIDKEEKVVKELEKAERVDNNSYKLMPGHSYTKDPTVTVLKGSEESYVRLLVTVTFGGKLTDEQLATKLDGIFTGYSSDWQRNGAPKNETKTTGEGDAQKEYTVLTYEYRYKSTVAGKVDGEDADNKLPALFKGITVPGTWTNDELTAIGGFEIKVVAQAIQADGFEDTVVDGTVTESGADKAWKAFDASTPTT